MGRKKIKNRRRIQKQLLPQSKLYLLPAFLSSIMIFFFSLYTFPWARSLWPVAILVGIYVGLWKGDFLELSLVSFFSTALVIYLTANFPAFRPHFQLDMMLSYLVPISSNGEALIMGLLSIATTVLTILLVRALKIKNLLIFCVLVLLLLNYLGVAAGYNEVLKIASQEPFDEKYRLDPMIFLKTFYLMERGLSFYKAYGEAYKKDFAHDAYPEYSQTFRFPTVFYLWKFFCSSGGACINYLFTFFSLLALICSFLIAWKFSPTPIAILAPVLLAPYLLYGNLTMWFLATEYWALFFGIFSVCLFVYGYILPSVILALLSALTRELGIFLLLAGLTASIMAKRKRKFFIWAVALIILLAAYFFHLNFARAFTSGKTAQGFFAWQLFRLDAFKAIAEFGFVAVPYNQIWAFPLLFMAIIGLYFISLKKESAYFLSGAVLIPTMVFLALGRDPGAGYWGVIWMPFVLISVPFFFWFLERKLSEFGGCNV